MEFWFSEFHTPDVKHSIRVNKQLYSKQSDYQRIDLVEMDPQVVEACRAYLLRNA